MSFPRWRSAALCAALALVTCLLFWPAAGYEFISYDDDLYLTANPRVATGLTAEGAWWAFTTFHAANWHPLTWVSHMADAEFFGMRPGAHHLVSVCMHAINGALLLLILFAMTGAPWRSAAVALLFAIHPLHVESVAWVSERKDVLSTLFMLLTIFAHLRYARRPGVGRYLAVVLLFSAGLMAKPMLVTLPVLLLLLDWWPLGRFLGRPPGHFARLAMEKAPLLTLSAASSLVTLAAQRTSQAIVSVEKLTLWDRAANASVSYVSYLGKTLIPVDLSVYYPLLEGEPPGWKAAAAVAILLLVSAAALIFASRYPYAPVGWFWYLGTLVPVIGLVQVGGQAMADRYTYVPLTGLFLAGIWLAASLSSRGRPQRMAIVVVVLASLTALAGTTRQQLGHWRESFSLFSRSLEAAPEGNWLAHYHLGLSLFREGRFEEAASNYRKVLDMMPADAGARIGLGAVRAAQGRTAEAESLYRQALRLNRRSALGHNNLAVLLAGRGDSAAAVEHLREALRSDPDFVESLFNLGVLLAARGERKEAAGLFRRVLRINPRDRQSREQLSRLRGTGGSAQSEP